MVGHTNQESEAVMDISSFVRNRREAGRRDYEIVSEMDAVNWAIRQGYRKPFMEWNEAQKVLFIDNLHTNEEK